MALRPSYVLLMPSINLETIIANLFHQYSLLCRNKKYPDYNSLAVYLLVCL